MAPLTIFDLDETLIDGDSGLIWNAFLVDKGIVSDPGFLQEDRRLMALYALGELDIQTYLNFTMAAIQHLSAEEIDNLAEQCVNEHILPRLYPQAKALLADLKIQQKYTLMISATVSFLVKKVAQKLNVNDAMGIDLVIKNGTYSAQIQGTASYQKGKVIRLKEWLKITPNRYTSIDFYTDSINDLALCLHADNPIMVNPCTQLKKQALRNQWPILNWSIK